MKRLVIASSVAGLLAGLVTMTLARFSRVVVSETPIVVGALSAGLVAGWLRARLLARRGHPFVLERALGLLALALAFGRLLWERTPELLGALSAALPSRPERWLACALALAPTVTLPVYALALAIATLFVRMPRGLAEGRLAFFAALAFPVGLLGGWLVLTAVGPHRALGLLALASVGLMLVVARSGLPARGAVAATVVLVLVLSAT